MTLFNLIISWIVFGLINYLIVLLKHKKDWMREGDQDMFILTLIPALIFGPIALFFNLVNSKGKPF
ncbi:MAG: hypothetical protein GY858_05645 [Candidatus Omnitrophica bacterium]|nr:hypothetical protein [Candidatus Omnitrophota bacterium]